MSLRRRRGAIQRYRAEVSDFLLGLAVALVIGGVLAVAGFFILRRLFERAAHRVADQIGRVLVDVSARAAASPAARGAARAHTAAGGFTNLGAYAAAHGMSEDAARQEFAESIERLARLMDGAIRIPVIGPVGLDALLGLFPVAGDATSAIVSVMLIGRSIKYGVPREIIARMLGNVVFDFLIGAVPVAGDVADMWFRANLRNVALLREYLGEQSRNTIEVTATRVS
ncbi:MAG TPA: DUF4112 domain-containing protein [Vicinamibacterales bacterium]|nr:DUF4112 domain-containing protein [Vicinamibacterales bacterium]